MYITHNSCKIQILLVFNQLPRNAQRQNLPGMQTLQGTRATWGWGLVKMRFRCYVCAPYVYSYIYLSTSELSAVARSGANVDNFI